MNSIIPAQLLLTDAGIPYSADYDDVYHSTDGALGQAQTVFLAGNDLPKRWQGKETFTIVETGFGEGLNFLVTWQAWRDDPNACAQLHFVSVEQRPFRRDDLALLHAHYPQFADLSAELLANWPLLTQGFHRLELAGGQVILTLLFGSANTMLPELQARADAIYLDGFSPAKNPDLWSPYVFRLLWRLSHCETTLATYTVAGTVRTGLTEAGFAVEKAPGFGGKRQMLLGRIGREPRQPPRYSGERHAIVIGAGLAGCAVTERLAKRGWRITLLDAADAPATGSSGNHVGLMHACCALDDNLLARLSRAGSEFMLHRLSALNGIAGFSMDGILQVAKHAEQEALMAKLVEQGNWPPELVQFLDQPATSRLLGTRTKQGGWWFERGAWVNPASVCKAWLDAAGSSVDARYGVTITKLLPTESGWQVFDERGNVVAEAPVVVLANATAATTLTQASELAIWDSWRVASRIKAIDTLPQHSVTGLAYLTGAYQGDRIIGAAAFNGNMDEAEANNRAMLATLFPDLDTQTIALTHSRACRRPNTLDRMPLIGAIPERYHAAYPRCHQPRQLPRQAGLYAAVGYGARGLTWASLGGEIIACQLSGEPMPVEQKLLHAIDPGRFLLRALRRDEAYVPEKLPVADGDEDDGE
ncbi:bifunctional tRNA (5-methylaminomethyl-2-thiouridine)(34)-methyltransferase MnmD/FAD-dependent 5-carboxymethylaminomethyl-2-thiouridine(34) oxidoreductase MnmC [Andreprevotia chitinilytica]|uniref:bifunctional tRNA (5-methylaminomethyl-2-thiouridine)(34)-methyltransferase MnmD/FAD-dependent 5-carboxymethylaminomethyl-2-thiouridine(34) oxidoreductase MnmC n=1 Tax=Andreprevotia chitinilytica TaxID=396808 RepID=UPI00068E94C7|nr:bifunctional tRNA (5-methylaminomethyl-2-thiouridine)(34)-methyltransferase MnmD/FAD-dependent 5-carboxymethylaminomethyl-2-thiouridine(34) oxidoreductase MnmC [Andreprevotia chitinilytica]